MNSKHTRGKWRTFQAADGNIYITSDTNDVAVIQTATRESIANSHLIASAPLMLEALETALHTLKQISINAVSDNTQRIIQNAINAAKGGAEK
jgi:hypothetical protein